MSDPFGTSKKRVIYVKFTAEHKIKKAELDKAIRQTPLRRRCYPRDTGRRV